MLEFSLLLIKGPIGFHSNFFEGTSNTTEHLVKQFWRKHEKFVLIICKTWYFRPNKRSWYFCSTKRQRCSFEIFEIMENEIIGDTWAAPHGKGWSLILKRDQHLVLAAFVKSLSEADSLLFWFQCRLHKPQYWAKLSVDVNQ